MLCCRFPGNNKLYVFMMPKPNCFFFLPFFINKSNQTVMIQSNSSIGGKDWRFFLLQELTRIVSWLKVHHGNYPHNAKEVVLISNISERSHCCWAKWEAQAVTENYQFTVRCSGHQFVTSDYQDCWGMISTISALFVMFALVVISLQCYC